MTHLWADYRDLLRSTGVRPGFFQQKSGQTAHCRPAPLGEINYLHGSDFSYKVNPRFQGLAALFPAGRTYLIAMFGHKLCGLKLTQ